MRTMAGLEFEAAGVRTPGAHGQTSAAPITNKLRDSCQACAMSKVKCPKEKPNCSRCGSRGLTCEYIFTRRPGRRRDARRQSNAGSSTKFSPSIDAENSLPVAKNTVEALQPTVEACFLSRGMSTPVGSDYYLDMSPQSLSIPASPRPDHVFAPEPSNVFSVMEEANMFSAWEDFGSDGNDLDFMSAMDSPFGTGIPVMDSIGMTEAHNDIGSLLIPPHGINIDVQSSEISSSGGPISASSRITAYTADIQVLATGHSGVTRATDTSACGCLTQSLDLLKTLSVQPVSQTGLSVSDPNEAHNTLAYGSPSSVLTENKQSIEAISATLTCPSCAGDNFLLAVLSMTVLKILDRYATAARGQSSGTKSSDLGAEKASRLSNSILASNKDQMTGPSQTYNRPHGRGRKAAQLVLGELHRVQRLVNQLSPRLKRSMEAETRSMEPELELWGGQKMAWGYDRGTVAPFSATTLGQMDSDVRNSLSALSSEIINELRHI